MILDTCFLIDLQRELKGSRTRGAKAFLRDRPAIFPKISIITWMEFAEGYPDTRVADCEKFLGKFPLVNLDSAIAWRASRIAQHLRALGTIIGDHDIWIAATALSLEVPVVTRNIDHFDRVPGLDLVRYAVAAA